MKYLASALAGILLLGVNIDAAAAADEPATAAAAPAALERLPAKRTIQQTAVIAGRTVRYDVTVGAIALKDDKGKVLGEAVYTAYTVVGQGQRPVTFSFNGGPGAASAYLNLGVLGPKVIRFGQNGDYASSSPAVHDNPNSWLGFTDLVFIDPIGTGFSRAYADDEATRKIFFSADGDIRYLSRVIYDWLQSNGRMTSQKYLIGESYGGYRVPRIAYYLQNEIGVGLSGITMVSPYLDPIANADSALSPLPYAVRLASMAAANFERQGHALDATTMAPVEAYLQGQFLADYLAGPGDRVATDRLVGRVTDLTGLDPELVRQRAGRIDSATYLRERQRTEGRVGSYYDPNVTGFDPFPTSASGEYSDPILAATAPFAEAINDLIINQIGWNPDARYFINNYDLNRRFDRDQKDTAVADLRKVMASDPNMKATIVHGWADLSTPYLTSRMLVAQMPQVEGGSQVRLSLFPGGHMFYARLDGASAFTNEMREVYLSVVNGS